MDPYTNTYTPHTHTQIQHVHTHTQYSMHTHTYTPTHNTACTHTHTHTTQHTSSCLTRTQSPEQSCRTCQRKWSATALPHWSACCALCCPPLHTHKTACNVHKSAVYFVFICMLGESYCRQLRSFRCVCVTSFKH